MNENSKKVVLLFSAFSLAFLSHPLCAQNNPVSKDIEASKLLRKANEVFNKNENDLVTAEQFVFQAKKLLDTLPTYDKNRIREIVQIEDFFLRVNDQVRALQIARELDRDVDNALKGRTSSEQLNACVQLLNLRIQSDILRNSHLIGRKLPPATLQKSVNLHKRMEMILDRLPAFQLDKAQYYREIQDFYKNNQMPQEAQQVSVKMEAALSASWKNRENEIKRNKLPCLGCGRG
ncbi:MAG: hypothetical protein SFY67_16860 [Candidatus Melainabacteria bacterium]|nr:hypothetical protein [Candidatus Melainabacteria bacterium]